MASFRLARTQEDIRRELTDIFRTLKDPRITTGLISIVRVELSNDLSYCTVYISSLQGMEQCKQAVAGLTSAAGFIRSQVNARVKMRRSPQLRFVADDSIAHSAQIAQTLDALKKGEEGCM